MSLEKLKEIVTLRAFKPDLTDTDFSLEERLRGQSIALVNYGKVGWQIAYGTLNKKLTIADTRDFLYNSECQNNCDKEALDYLKQLEGVPCLAISWGLKTSYSIGAAIPYEALSMRSHSIPQENINLNGYFQEKEYINFEKMLETQGFKVLRTQLTALNVLNQMLDTNSSTTESTVFLVVD